MEPKILFSICARGGSKGLPNKKYFRIYGNSINRNHNSTSLEFIIL